MGDNVRTVRAGLVGLGRFGKLHAAVLASLPGAQLAAICDPDAVELDRVGDRYGIAHRFGSYADFLAHADVDCVFLVTPEPLHAEQALQAIERGWPVFLEKPLATTAAEGERVAMAARSAGVPLHVGFVLRFETRYALLKQAVDQGRFGKIITARVKRNVSKAWFEVYGDRAHAVHETAIHDIDVLLWLLQDRCTTVYAVQRHVSSRRFPDATVALLQFASGAVAVVETSWFVPARGPANVLAEAWHGTIDAEMELVGTERTARLRGLETGLEIWTDDVIAVPDPGLWPEVHGRIGGALRDEDAHFIECVRSGRPSAITSVDDAVTGLRIAEAIIASAEQGREVGL